MAETAGSAMADITPVEWVKERHTPISIVPHSTLGFLVLANRTLYDPNGEAVGVLPGNAYYHCACGVDAVVALRCAYRVFVYDIRLLPHVVLVETILSPNAWPTAFALSMDGCHIAVGFESVNVVMGGEDYSTASMVLKEVGKGCSTPLRLKGVFSKRAAHLHLAVTI